MAKIISIHSFRGGTGKSNTAANIAALLAGGGKKTGVVDTDIQSPGIHVLFGIDQAAIKYTLNDFLWGKCEIRHASYDMSQAQGIAPPGKLFLIPSSVKTGDIARVLHYGYDVNLLREGFQRLIDELALDYLLIDTHPGLNEETLLSIALSDVLIIVLRPDQQDYQGSAVTVEVSRQLEVPSLLLLVNKVPSILNMDDLKQKVEKTYNCPVAGLIPHSEEMMVLASSGIFALHYPHHPVTELYRRVADMLTA
ncbi:MAG: MinD/ParA family protein [Deltaproteobacteria bacterium]|nr:MinD/ParA family protein [Deltaproteobacteria bacterium]